MSAPLRSAQYQSLNASAGAVTAGKIDPIDLEFSQRRRPALVTADLVEDQQRTDRMSIQKIEHRHALVEAERVQFLGQKRGPDPEIQDPAPQAQP